MKRVFVYRSHEPIVVDSPDEITHTVVMSGERPVAILDPRIDDLSKHLSPRQRANLAPHLSKRPGMV